MKSLTGCSCLNIISLSPLSESRGCLRTAKKTPHHCYSCLQGGLAAEEFGELAAWRPSRRHPDSEETPAEHAHLNPCSAQEHEMETVGSASMRTAFTLILHG